MFPNSEDFSNDPRARSIGRSQEFWRRESGPGRLLEGSGGAGRRAHRAQRIRQVNTAQPDCGRGAAHEGGDHLGRTTDRPLARPSSRWTGYCEDTPDPEAVPGDDVSGECRGRGDVWKPRATGIREGPRRGRSRARPRGIGTKGGRDVLEPDRPGTQVLRQMGLEAKQGVITVLIGPNGAGKSTTLKIVNGLLRPTRGQVSFAGEDITKLPAHERSARGIGSCPEGRRLFPLLTAEGNLRLGAYAPRARAAADETLAYVYDLFPRLRERASVKAGRLSGGEQQMVGIGRALMSKPSILVLDEPSLGLAPKLVSEIFEKIHELRQGGLTVLMVEQNAYQALRIADCG